jgi:hypothetical protein
MTKRLVQTSDAPVAKKVVLPQGDAASIAERFKDFPAIDVLTRRFENPGDPGSLPILLKDESSDTCVNTEHHNRLKAGATRCHLCKKPARKWYVRWANFGQEGRAGQIRAKGYVAVEIRDLQNSDDVADLYRSDKDNLVRRGDRGQEILVKMPLEAYNFVKGKQRDQWNAKAISNLQLKKDLAEAAGNELGDEAGQAIEDGGIQIESMKRTRTTLGEEANGRDA